MQQVLENPIIESTDTFSDPAVTGWLIKSGSMQSGSLVIEGNGAWGGVGLEAPFAEGQADSMLVIIDEAAQTEIFFKQGTFNTSACQRFGIYLSLTPTTNIWEGLNSRGFNALQASLALAAGTPCALLLAAGQNADFTAIIWDPAHPGHQRMVRERIGQRWAGGTWNLHIGANTGELTVAEATRWNFGTPTPTPTLESTPAELSPTP
jgi:hypothetical protein